MPMWNAGEAAIKLAREGRARLNDSQQRARKPDPSDTGASDIFLHVQTKRAGKVKGEGATAGHVDDIEVVSWNWGASAGSSAGSLAPTARRSYRQLVVAKRIDAASTALLSALATNDEVKEATLTMRRAGGEALDYFRMTLKGARVTAVDVEVGADGFPLEMVAFNFTEIEIEYQKQQASGGSGGACTFNDVLLPAG
ncbi:MAG TPA: type VI secretion system tube protein Hcp [Burkholderiaceae bacterium]|nr:type VI secretion system tube protein Hcp [Burkholderiaceae bacterium]